MQCYNCCYQREKNQIVQLIMVYSPSGVCLASSKNLPQQPLQHNRKLTDVPSTMRGFFCRNKNKTFTSARTHKLLCAVLCVCVVVRNVRYSSTTTHDYTNDLRLKTSLGACRPPCPQFRGIYTNTNINMFKTLLAQQTNKTLKKRTSSYVEEENQLSRVYMLGTPLTKTFLE